MVWPARANSSKSAGHLADLPEMLAARHRDEDDVGFREPRDRTGIDRAGLNQSRHGIGIDVVNEHLLLRLLHEVPAHGLTHDAQTDEAEGGRASHVKTPEFPDRENIQMPR